MKFNEELAEKPDHAHYPVCLSRKLEIEAFCQKCFFYTLLACLLMIILTMFTVRFNIISLIPNLIGDGTMVGANFVQVLILLSMIGMAGLAVGKYKFLNIILFLIYFAMAVSCFFNMKFSNFFTMPIGLFGIALTFKSFGAYCDYKQLSKTEGFPFFNERLAEQTENSSYKSRYEEEYHQTVKKEMPVPQQNVQNSKFNDIETLPEMDQLDISSAIVKKQTASDTSYMFIPEHKKYCAMSDSPRKNI